MMLLPPLPPPLLLLRALLLLLLAPPQLSSSSTGAGTTAAAAKEIRIAPNCSSQPLGSCNTALQFAFSARCPAVNCTVVLQRGNYLWSLRSAVIATGLRNLTVLADGATLQLTGSMEGHGPGVLVFAQCDGVRVQGLAMDAPRSFYTLARVVHKSVNASTVTVEVDPAQYPLLKPASNELLMPWLATAQAILGWDPVHNRPAGTHVDIYQMSAPAGSFHVINASHASLRVIGSVVSGKAGIGDITNGLLVIRHAVYTIPALVAKDCTDIELLHVTLYAAPGMGFRAERCVNVRLDHYRVSRAAGKSMSTCADASHFQTCGGHIEITNSQFEAQGDDGINVHSNFLDVTETRPGLKQVVACMKQMGECAHGLGGGVLQYIHTGDTLQFYSRHSLQPLFRTVVTRLQEQDNATVLTLSGSMPSVSEMMFAQFVSLRWMPSVSVTGCRFADNRGRGILIGSTGVRISNNTFFGCSGAAFKEQPGNYEYAESNFLNNFEFVANHVEECNAGPVQHKGAVWISTFLSTFDQSGVPSAVGTTLESGTAMRNLTITSNTFIQNLSAVSLPLVAVDSTAGLNISSNTIMYHSGPRNKSLPLAINVRSSVNVTITRNVCVLEGSAASVNRTCAVSSIPPTSVIDNMDRVDEHGVPVDAHDGEVIQISTTDVYWLGMEYGLEPLQSRGCAKGPGQGRAGFRLDHNVTLHRAASITSRVWTKYASLLPPDRPEGIYWRPKLLKTAQGFVLWARRAIVITHSNSSWPTLNTYIVFSSPALHGPYKIINENATVQHGDGNGGGGGDFALFQDDDDSKSCYIVYKSSAGIIVQKLNPTCTGVSAYEIPSTPLCPSCEAPAMFKRGKIYYLLFGQDCCYCSAGSGVHVYHATTPLGPYQYQGQINRGGNGSITNAPLVHAQQAAVTLVDGVWMWQADRWQHALDKVKGHDPQAWLPLRFTADDDPPKIQGLVWQSSWNPDEYGIRQ
jgi:hypothetical protein